MEGDGRLVSDRYLREYVSVRPVPSKSIHRRTDATKRKLKKQVVNRPNRHETSVTSGSTEPVWLSFLLLVDTGEVLFDAVAHVVRAAEKVAAVTAAT